MSSQSAELAGSFVDVIILVPTDKEILGIEPLFTQLLAARGVKKTKAPPAPFDFVYEHTTPKDLDRSFRVALHNCAAMGNVASAVNAAFMSSYHPKLLISAGIAGSLDPERAWVGDVLLPTSIFHYRYNKVSDTPKTTPPAGHGLDVFDVGKFLLREDSKQEKLPSQSKAFVTGLGSFRDQINSAIASEPLSAPLAEYLEELRVTISAKEEKKLVKRAQARWVEEFSTFSWEKVLDSMAYARALPKTAVPSECTCVEMESYGFAEAMKRFVGDHNYTVPLVVRGISDIVGHKSQMDKLEEGDTPRLRAMRNVSRMLDFLIFDVQFSNII